MVLVGCLIFAEAIFVATNGNDAANGNSTHPVLSLNRAIELARKAHIHRIVIDKGEYSLRASVQIDARDAGLTIEARKGTRPLLTGAELIHPAQITKMTDPATKARVQASNKSAVALVANLPGQTLSPFTTYGFGRPVIPGPSELFRDGIPMKVARWPNVGFAKVKKVVEAGNGEHDRNAPPRKPRFVADSDRPKTWTTTENAWLYGYWKFDWADESIKLDGVDPTTGELTLAKPHAYGVDANIPFFAENLPEEMDAIDEYYVDPARQQIQFVATANQKSRFRVSLLGEPILTLNGAVDVVIRGLDFGFSRGDGADLTNCVKSRFEGCQFFDLGERAVVISGGRDCGLLGCNIWNTAEGGVSLDGGDRATLTPSRHYVDNCDIHHYQRRSQTYRPAVGIAGVGQRVSHCAMHDAPHSAIIFSGNDHVIEGNEFYRTISRTGDGGVVYTGRDWTARGTEIRHNFFHDNIGQGKWEPAIYLDDLASGIKATGNWIERCHWGFLVGGGRDNTIRGNRIEACKLAFHLDARGLGWAASSKPTMMERLNAVPYKSEIWRAKYPTLASILENNPMSPMGNVIYGNLLKHSGRPDQDIEKQFIDTATFDRNSVNDGVIKWDHHPYSGTVDDAIRSTLPRYK